MCVRQLARSLFVHRVDASRVLVCHVTFASRAAPLKHFAERDHPCVCARLALEMAPTDVPQRDETGSRVFPLFAFSCSGEHGPHDACTPKRSRTPPPKGRASKSRTRPSSTTLFAAWGQESPISATVPEKANVKEPIQRTVRGSRAPGGVHPFFAKRETKSSTNPNSSTRACDNGCLPRKIAPAPWPTHDMVHVVPEGWLDYKHRLTWPQRTRQLSLDMPLACSLASGSTYIDWTCLRSSPAARVPSPVKACRGTLNVNCEASIMEAGSDVPEGSPAPRTPLAYIGPDLAAQGNVHMPPAVTHLLEQLMPVTPKILSSRPKQSTHASVWMDHWRPRCAAHVLGNEESALFLRDWLHDLRVSYSSARQRPIQTRTMSRKRGRPRSLMSGVSDLVDDPASDAADDAIVDAGYGNEDDEYKEFHPEEIAWFNQFRTDVPDPGPAATSMELSKLTNCIVLTGPTGVGKSAAVYACATELGFEVFELYAGMGRRSGKDLASAVGQLTRNHMVLGDARVRLHDMPHQSLILLDEVDVLFDDDAGFWPAVVELIAESRRPVVLTCNDLDAVPLAELPVQRVLTWEPAPAPVAATYLQLIALAEGYIVSNAAMHTLYTSTRLLADRLDPPSGPVSPMSNLFPSSYMMPHGHAYDLRAALAQLPWICLHTRAEDLLREMRSPKAGGMNESRNEHESTSAACESGCKDTASLAHSSSSINRARAELAALRTMYEAAETQSYADLVCHAHEYTDEYVPLPARNRASVSRIPSVPCTSMHVPSDGSRLERSIQRALGVDETAHNSLTQRMDQDRLEHCQQLHTLLQLLHVPVQEQLPRTSIPLDYAPYVRVIHTMDMAHQQAWATYLYNNQATLMRVTRNSMRLAPDVRAYQAWLPFGPAEREAAQRTSFV